MSAVDLYFDGFLVAGRTSAPVSVRYASRYSLWLKFDGRNPRRRRPVYEKLSLAVDGKSVEMGPCEIIEDDDAQQGEFRLVPRRSIHDFEKLFFRSRVDILESAAVNLPLILSYKGQIRPEFSEYVSELTYDLGAYRTIFDQMDAHVQDEPEHVRTILRRGIIDTVGTKLLDYLESQHNRLKQITDRFTDDEHEHHGFYFRKQLWNFILTSPIMSRTNLKPRGYIGDSEMMRMIYLNDYQGDSTFGQILHRYSVAQPAAQAVRNRRGDLARKLRDYMHRRRSGNGSALSRVTVLSVACGPAMELTEIFQAPEDCRSLHFSLLDQDRHALLEAAKVVEEVERRLGGEVSADFIKESVRTMLVTKELQDRWGRFDFVYSMGLFDYLTRPVAAAVLLKLYNLLLPGGEMIVGNFSPRNPTMTYMAYWMDWTIIYRSDDEMLALADELPGAVTTVTHDETGIQLLLHVRKSG